MTLAFNAKQHRYTLDGKALTGVTTVLGVIAKPQLIGWAANMAVDYVKEHLYDGDIDHLRNVVLEEARKAHQRKKEAGGVKGKDVHALVEEYIKRCIADGATHPADADADPMVAKFATWACENDIKFLASEERVYSREWWLAGTFDFSFEKDGKRFIGDLKTMKRMWDRTPFFQTAAYRKMSIEMGQPMYDGSCIVNINKESHELTVHWSFDWESDQKAFEAALTLYRQLNQ